MAFTPRLLNVAQPGTLIRFSANEQYVTIANLSQAVDSFGIHTFTQTTRTFKRPILSPWSYSPPGTTYWVSPTGNDSANGRSPATAWKTFVHAAAVVVAGDLVYFLPGTYSEIFIANTSGTAGNPIIWSCAPGCLGLVNFVRPPADVITHPFRSVITVLGFYNTFNGLILRGAKGMQGAPTSGQDSLNACGIFFPNVNASINTNTNKTNCAAYNSTHCGAKNTGGNSLLEGNIWFSNGIGTQDHGMYFSGPNNIIHGNIVLDNYGDGIHCYSGQPPPESPDNNTTTYNLCVGNTFNIVNAGANCVLKNNTCSGGYCGIQLYQGGAFNNDVEFNICAFSSTFNAATDHAGTNTSNNNDLFGAQSGNFQWPTGLNDIAVNPGFVNRNGGDYTTTNVLVATMGCYA